MSQLDIFGIPTITLRRASGFVLTIPTLVAQDNSVYFETEDMDMGETLKEKYVDKAVFDLESMNPEQSEIYCQFGYRNYLKDPITWTDEYPIPLNNPMVTPRVQGRFIKIKVNDKSPFGQWKCSKIELYGRVMGGRL